MMDNAFKKTVHALSSISFFNHLNTPFPTLNHLGDNRSVDSTVILENIQDNHSK